MALTQANVTKANLESTAKGKLVVAIDFGTTYSGWAASLKDAFQENPINIFSRSWEAGQVKTNKTPTTILMQPDGKTVEAFGYEAENRYLELAENEEIDEKEWFYFKAFKMSLHAETISRGSMLKDHTSKELPAMTVFAAAIEFMKEDVFKALKNTDIGPVDNWQRDIDWVLTVPAIWSDAAKQFMREAATKAGLLDHKIQIALEPEAASMYCKYLPMEATRKKGQVSFNAFKPGKKYLVLDAGGGTVDVTVHEVTKSGELKELHKATGDAWGGIKVDEEYRKFYAKVFGQDVFEEFKKKHTDDYLQLMRDFETKKRSIHPDNEDDLKLNYPYSLKTIFEETVGQELGDLLDQSVYRQKVSVDGDTVTVTASVGKGFFKEAIRSILQHLEDLLQQSKVEDISTVIMIGGFSDSPMLQNAVEKLLERKKIDYVHPEEATLAVLKGAVIFGHHPTLVVARICKKTYGIGMLVPFINGKHPERKRVYKNREFWCKDVFSIHVRKDQIVRDGEALDKMAYSPSEEEQTHAEITVYASDEEEPKFVDDPGCRPIGKIVVNMPDTDRGLNRIILVQMTFSGTEIKVEGEDRSTGLSVKSYVDFLKFQRDS